MDSLAELSSMLATDEHRRIFYEEVLPRFIESTEYVDAREYYEAREADNARAAPLISDFEQMVRGAIAHLKIEHILVPMSSYPRLNLIGSSDYDLGLLVHGLTAEVLAALAECLLAAGFTAGSVTVNKHLPGGDAHRFSIMYQGLDCEVKIRDVDCVTPLVALHRRLDHLAEEESIFWTYQKLVHKTKRSAAEYTALKLSLFHFYFCGIEGAFTFG